MTGSCEHYKKSHTIAVSASLLKCITASDSFFSTYCSVKGLVKKMKDSTMVRAFLQVVTKTDNNIEDSDFDHFGIISPR